MKVFLTTRIHSELQKLQKQNATKQVKKDICSFFISKVSFDAIIDIPKELLPKSNEIIRKKSRVENSISKDTRGGYRLYYLIAKQKQLVILASVYSKKNKDNYSVKEIKDVFESLNEDMKNNRLIEVDIQNVLAPKKT